MVDGVRLSSATAGTQSWESIPVEMIERIEVLKGPASALYGSDGVGGVVQIFLRKGRDGFHPYAISHGRQRRPRHAQRGPAGRARRAGLFLRRATPAGRGLLATNPKATFGRFNPDRDPFEQNSVNADRAL